MENRNYSSTVSYSSMELSARERIRIKDTSTSIKIDDVVTPDAPLVIPVKGYVVLDIHNDKSDDKDYKNYVIVGADGNTYISGSESLFNSFKDIFEEMEKEGGNEEYSVEVSKLPSKNYTNKYFLTCSIL